MLSKLSIAMVSYFLICVASAVGQWKEQEAIDLIRAMVVSRTNINDFVLECDTAYEYNGKTYAYRYVTRSQGENHHIACWLNEELSAIVSSTDGTTASHFGIASGTGERAELRHAATAIDSQFVLGVHPRQLGILDFSGIDDLDFNEIFLDKASAGTARYSAIEKKLADGTQVVEVTIDAPVSKTTILIDPQTLQVHQLTQTPGYDDKGYLQIDSVFYPTNTTVVPSEVITQKVVDEKVVKREELKVTKFELNPTFDKDAFGLQSLGLRIGQDVSVPDLSVIKVWNGSELQSGDISPRIMAAVEEVTQPENQWSMTTITLLVLAGIGAALLGVRQIVARRSP